MRKAFANGTGLPPDQRTPVEWIYKPLHRVMDRAALGDLQETRPFSDAALLRGIGDFKERVTAGTGWRL